MTFEDGTRAVDQGTPELGLAILHEQERYWRTLGRHVMGAAFPLGGIAILMVVGELSRGSATDFTLRFNISTGSALGALGILATIIVALQIAVRTPGQDPDDAVPEQLARQRVLESLAEVAGMAAISIAVATAISNAPLDGVIDIPSQFGPPLGGLLLAVLAADAACASENRLDPLVRGAAKRISLSRVEALLKSHEDLRTPPFILRFAQLVFVLVLVPAIVTAISIPMWPATTQWSVPVRASTLVFLTIFYAVGTAMYVEARLSKQTIRAVEVGLVVIGVGVTTVAIIAALGLGGNLHDIDLADARSLIIHVLASSFLVFSPLGMVYLLCHRLPGGYPGLGLDAILARSRFRMRQEKAPVSVSLHAGYMRWVWNGVAVLGVLIVAAVVTLYVLNPEL
ncbi:hypothetical protein D9V32_09755 [Mycetocola tolaasinivorans]|uniref:Uncharacterized protein n=1 Tax=Mycetocola tolaasinivorans TaxID=76635 RepID=A0A3L7A5Y4_9MICO|nr:hypothetical protein [Mycetocola tolaasinivorans]RLP75736.1 hypothetical protein D9V32_09755 [Mycetocola tolaasinivorans]